MVEARRLKLQEELYDILGNKNVYYQPPESFKMKYPCIRFKRTGVSTKHANDRIYKARDKYELVVIDSDPDSELPYKVLNHFQMCALDREYCSDNLNHFVFTLYY